MVPEDLNSAMAAARVRRAANPSAVLRLFEEDEELATMKMMRELMAPTMRALGIHSGDESYTETDYDETDYDEEEEEEEDY
jgi:hypothetical protein